MTVRQDLDVADLGVVEFHYDSGRAVDGVSVEILDGSL